MNTSFSSAPLQIGRLFDRQKARLQRLHEADPPPILGLRSSFGSASRVDECSGLSLMMVLFAKQVHLQKLGGARTCQLYS